MGNCLERCFGKVNTKRNKYFTGRYNNSKVDIEFENLIEDDDVQQNHAVLTEEERNHLLNHRYTDLVSEQQRVDARLDRELAQEEENARLEEEAYNSARREAARAAHQARELETQRSRPQKNGSAKSWLGSDAGDWEIATEDDFETFLETVKAKSETVRASGSGRLSRYIGAGHESSNHSQAHDDDSDVEWEADFVSADSTPEPIRVPSSTSSSKSSSKAKPFSSSNSIIPAHSDPIKTGLPALSRTNGSTLANGRLPYKQEDKPVSTTSKTASTSSTKASQSQSSPSSAKSVKPKKTLDIDIEKFLEELDFE